MHGSVCTKAPHLAPLSRAPQRNTLSYAPSLCFLMRASLATHRGRPLRCEAKRKVLRAHSRFERTLRLDPQAMARIPLSRTRPAGSTFRLVVSGSAKLRQMHEPSMFLRCMARFAQKAPLSRTSVSASAARCAQPRTIIRFSDARLPRNSPRETVLVRSTAASCSQLVPRNASMECTDDCSSQVRWNEKSTTTAPITAGVLPHASDHCNALRFVMAGQLLRGNPSKS